MHCLVIIIVWTTGCCPRRQGCRKEEGGRAGGPLFFMAFFMNENIQTFLKYRKEFSLGHLTTEGFHEKSKHLSHVVNENIIDAISILKDIDNDALEKLKSYENEIYNLHIDIHKTLKKNNKIFISGCGATGRLAISLERIFRELYQSDQVIGFMAGGDFALISAVEKFEDSFEYSYRQMRELGFKDGDMLIAITEGGETSFVIGTVHESLKSSVISPYFVYCNPDDELKAIKRSSEILENASVKKLNLCVGEMAISGSTRMQATTVQMLAVGFSLLRNFMELKQFKKEFEDYIDELKSFDFSFLSSFIEKEAEHYQGGGILTYCTDKDLAICLLTDTTERSPTFGLKSFESVDSNDPSLAYLSIDNEDDNKNAWHDLLGREPRCLNWKELEKTISSDALYKLDISKKTIERRENLGFHKRFLIHSKDGKIEFNFDHLSYHLPLKSQDPLYKNILLKIIVNTLSTLSMGRLGRYQGNMMTHLKTNNFKLIDRAFRYVKELLKQCDLNGDDEEILKLILDPKMSKMDGALVMNVFEKMKSLKITK